MPSGNRRTGWKRPNTPGSRSVGEDITSTGAWTGNGDPARTAIRIRRHRTHHLKSTNTQPKNHTVTNKSRKGDTAGEEAGVATAGTVESANGWLICSIADDNGGATAGALRHSNWL